MKLNISNKHMQIDKANARMVVIIAVAAVIVTFSLVASRVLLGQMAYQNRVIKERSKAARQLQENVKAAKRLVTAYREFDGAAESVIGTADKNSKVVLDALPSKYDFPALASSLEKILTQGGYTIDAITGTDEELSAQQDAASPTPVEMPFQVSAGGNYDGIKRLVDDFLRSIRPIVINGFDVSGSDAELHINITAKTYYQPEKNLNSPEKVIK